jgi:hypothetical protein
MAKVAKMLAFFSPPCHATIIMVSFKMFRRNASTDVDIRSPEEKALVRRLDMFLMTFGCLSQGVLGYKLLSRLGISKLTEVSYQISRSTEYQQCVRIWHEGRFKLARK